MILAEASSQFAPPVLFAGWLACVAFAAWFFLICQRIYLNSKAKPAPGDVRYEAANKFATKEELAALTTSNDGVHKDIFSKIGGVERGASAATERKLEELRHERREDMRILHNEINEVGKKVAGLEKETELQNQSMARMDSKLDRLIERKS